MPRTYTPRPKMYTEASIAVAIEEVNNGASVKSTAKKYHMSTSMLRMRVQASKGIIILKTQGVKCKIPIEKEVTLAACVTRMAELGFGPTFEEFRAIVYDWLLVNEDLHLFNNNPPGYEWARNFMKRHKLSLKKCGVMQLARKNVTSDPFVIYGFYSMLEREVERLGISNRPECFWNLDESGFPTDPSKWRVIGPIGAKTVRVIHGCNKENTTVMAVCCADGRALDPLIVFKGKNLMSNWRGDDALPDTYYATSDNGWMTTAIFHAWLECFCQTIKTRPLLLIMDGHLTHTSVQTIELAQKENITLLKLPAHTTDVLQPLDVACFAPLKSYYEKELTARVHRLGAREPLRKADFVNLLSSIWKLGLTSNNVKAGFRATGIYPVDATKYKMTRLDQVKLKTYRLWEEAGKPFTDSGEPCLTHLLVNKEDTLNMPSTSTSTPVRSQICTITDIPSHSAAASPTDITSPSELIKILQRFAPPGMRYTISLVPKEDETSLESIIKSRGCPSSANSQPKKRHRISMHGSILTNAEYKKQTEEKTVTTKVVSRKRSAPHESDTDSSEDSPELEWDDSSNSGYLSEDDCHSDQVSRLQETQQENMKSEIEVKDELLEMEGGTLNGQLPEESSGSDEYRTMANSEELDKKLCTKSESREVEMESDESDDEEQTMANSEELDKKLCTKSESREMESESDDEEQADIQSRGNKKLFKCNECNYESNRRHHLTRHMIVHGNVKLFECSQCNYECNRKDRLKKHMIFHGIYCCRFCNFSVENKKELKSHEKTHEKGDWKCHQCNYEGNCKSSFDRHMLSHSNVRLFKCTECSYESKRKEHLVRHMITHGDKKLFKCSECSYECNRKEPLKNHLLIHGIYTCNFCNFARKNENEVKIHLMTHNRKDLKCSHCGFESTLRSKLTRHMLTHNEAKLFKCTECSYECNRKDHLKRHMLGHIKIKKTSNCPTKLVERRKSSIGPENQPRVKIEAPGNQPQGKIEAPGNQPQVKIEATENQPQIEVEANPEYQPQIKIENSKQL